MKLVNSLLDFSRIEARRVEVRFEHIDLGRFTAELASNQPQRFDVVALGEGEKGFARLRAVPGTAVAVLQQAQLGPVSLARVTDRTPAEELPAFPRTSPRTTASLSRK